MCAPVIALQFIFCAGETALFLTILRGSPNDWRYRIKDQLDEDGIHIPIFDKGEELLDYFGTIVTEHMNETVGKIKEDLADADLG